MSEHKTIQSQIKDLRSIGYYIEVIDDNKYLCWKGDKGDIKNPYHSPVDYKNSKEISKIHRN